MEQSVEQKLRALYKLQSIHSKIDGLRHLRGELPIEVSDLEDEIEGLNTRISKIKHELDELEDAVVTRKNMIKDAQALIKKYEAQQNNVKNNREYEALAKEIEIQGLEIEVCEKKIKEYQFEIKNKTELYNSALTDIEPRKGDLDTKKAELDVIVAETQKEEDDLLGEAEKAHEGIEDRLMFAYNRLRNNFKNGLAVTTIERDACSGCFNRIPPQKQSDIRQRKKIIVCEYCGRLLVDEEIAREEAEKVAAQYKL